MNILFLTTHFNEGGISRYCLNLGIQLKKEGHGVYVASSGGDLVEVLERSGIEHIKINLRTKSELSLKIWCALFRFKKPLCEKNIQLIHAQTRVAQVLACWISKFYKIPYVSTCHGFFRPRLSRKLFPCWGKKVIAISRPVMEHLIKDFKIPAEKIKYIRHGLDMQRFRDYDEKTRQDLKHKLKIAPGAPVVGIIARLSLVKGHAFLIEAMPEVVKEFSAARLLIVGDGKSKDALLALRRLAEKLKVAENITFLPRVLDTSLMLSILDIFVMPSLQEGLGLSVMEAMAMSVPVIASAVGGIPDLIKDNRTGILVPPGDSSALSRAIVRLLENRDLRGELSKNAAGFIREEFSVTKMADETEAVYQEVLSQKVP